MNINHVTISGNLTRDPELRMTAGGTQVLSFGVAVNDRRRNPQSGEWEEYPNFIDGKLRYTAWERDGQKRSKIEVIVNHIEAMSRSKDNRAEDDAGCAPAILHAPSAVDVYDEDIPF